MGTHPASARVASELARVVLDVQRLEELWERDGDVSLTEFWQECERTPGKRFFESDAVRLGALIKADLRRRFERGESVPVARYLENFPELRSFDSRVISLIYEEYCLREERGECLDVSRFCGRYPEWKDSLASQLQYHRLLSQAAGLGPPPPTYPDVGGSFEEFDLLTLIGKGGSSRVYLASDRSLGFKRVVLKVSLDRGQEEKTLGALDHPHIVPVHSVVFRHDTSLRGLSMPYRPGLPLDEIVKRLPASAEGRSARDLWRALVEGLASSGLPLSEEQRALLDQEAPSGDGWDGYPIDGSFARGAAWVAMVLARTLHYAHRMKTFHRDVKPGNVLLTLGHGPQLLDFNLAESPHSASHAESAMLGGTLPYMAPEQIEAFLNPDLWGKVGARSDLYSLGLVLRELLTGIAPDLPDEKLPTARAMRELLDRRVCLVTDVGQTNPEIPHALRSIVELCLKLDPDERYPDAGALAVDLERFLKRQPLATAVNPSRRERTANWVIRNRRDLGIVGSLGSLVAILAGTLFVLYIAPLLRPDPSKLELMARAARAMKEGRAHEAVPLLDRIRKDYPGHPLPAAALGIAEALSTSLYEGQPQRDMREGLEQGAEAALLAWGRDHPELPEQLNRFIDDQVGFLQKLKSRQNVPLRDGIGKQLDGPGHRDLENDRQVERTFRETWLPLVRVGLKIDPDHRPLRLRFLEIEEYFGRHESAYRGWSDLIGSVPKPTDRPSGVQLVDWNARRNRISVAWSRELLKSGKPDDARRAGELLNQAAEDLARNESYISSLDSELRLRSPRTYDFVQLIFNHYWIGTEIWLSLGQLRDDQGRRDEAELTYKKALSYFRRLESHRNAFLRTMPSTYEDLEHRVLSKAGTQRSASR